MTLHKTPLVPTLLLLASCANKLPSSSDTGRDDDTGPAASSTADGPCTDGGWGSLGSDEASRALVVDVDGDDANDGTIDAPLASLAEALSRVDDGASPVVLVGPGRFDTVAALNVGGGLDVPVTIAGCGADAESGTVLVGTDADPVLDAFNSDVSLRDVHIEGGRRSLQLWGGGTAQVERVSIAGPVRTGIVVQGSDTILAEVTITDPVAEMAAAADGSTTLLGMGLSVDRAIVEIRSVRLENATGIAMLAEESNLDIQGLSVSGVSADSDGRLGRAVQLQGRCVGTLSALDLREVVDAGLFIIDPEGLSITDSHIQTATGATFEGDDGIAESGDGVVVLQSGGLDPASLTVAITSTTVKGAVRAGIILDAVTATELTGNDTTDNGVVDDKTGGSSWVQGGGTVVAGDGAWTLAEEPFALDRLGLSSEEVE